MRKIRVGILGASGYTGSDLLRFLLTHPSVDITHLTADKHAGKRISDVFPHLSGFCDLELKPLDPETLPEDIDVVFLALPHGASAKVVGELYKRDVRIIDLGADFRLSHEVYTVWYGEHPHPGLIPEAVYGIPEINRERLKSAKIVANPGCYPTSVILGLLPLAWEQLLQPGLVIADSKSGVSGAGRSPSLDTHFCEVNEGLKAYKVGEHRLSGPNDLVFDRSGGIWFTDLGKNYPRSKDRGGLYYCKPDGSLIKEAAYGFVGLNGVGLSPDEKTVYAAETETGKLWGFDIVGVGEVAKAPLGPPGRCVAVPASHVFYDSLAVQANGDVCVATILNGGVTTITPAGATSHTPFPGPIVTNIAFGGADMRDAYITLSGTSRLIKARWPEPGLKLNFAPY